MEGAAARLEAAGIATARLDAELLLRHVLGWERADVITRGSEAVPGPAVALFEAAVTQRARRRPLQHLTGHQAFWKHDFMVTPDVLIPRPETELLVETALELVRDRPAPLVVDVGTGSGCIALSLAAERPDARVHAVDLSPAALLVARGNAARLHLDSRVTFHEGDLLEPMRPDMGAIDLVVSNPPYVSAEEWATLEPEVRDHDPRLALVPPEGVPALYDRLITRAAAALRPGGSVLVEIGAGDGGRTAAIMVGRGLTGIETRRDLQGIARLVYGRRPHRP
ncbi:MAG TPA: peptide chain release factor N(5)-glutamine methyltransferase [Vicinamibacteria bacterium]|nr:peptide chain release factor N(5)-glutamine methyltransferase [Vicinamibacteria bacterium]